MYALGVRVGRETDDDDDDDDDDFLSSLKYENLPN